MNAALLNVETSLKGQTWISSADMIFDQPDAQAVLDRKSFALAQQQDLDPLVARLLTLRGQTPETAQGFLDPSLKALMPDPSSLKDLDKAVERIVQAMESGETIALYGDYDVDGASSVALFTRFLRAFGAAALVHIPNRLTEGYGPNLPALEALQAKGASLCLMVDCGTTAFEPLEAIQGSGLDVIVFDHHQAEPRLPTTHALVNPKRLDDTSSLQNLCAAGVVFMALVALNRALKSHPKLQQVKTPPLLGLLDLVAVATVCDVVPLTGLNRAFVKQGLKVMAQRGNAGLNALCDVASVDQRPQAYHCGFVFGPRINAAGRLGQSSIGHHLLSTDDPTQARELAMRLDSLNADRKTIEGEILDEAARLARNQVEAGHKSLVLAGSKWHAGVTGIIASRMKDAHALPAIVISVDDRDQALGTGSGRSVKGVDLGDLITKARLKGLLLKGGGHAMAAGLTIEPAKIDPFHEFLNEKLAQIDLDANKQVPVDLVLAASGASVELADAMAQLEPFGAANPEPKIVLNKAKLAFVDRMGDNHLKLVISDDTGHRLRAVAFRIANTDMGEVLFNGQGQYFHLLGTLKHDQWMSKRNGAPAVQFIVEDAAPAA